MKQLQDIINKVRQIYRFDTKLKNVIQLPVSVRLAEENSELKIKAIIFEDTFSKECVFVSPKSISHLENNEWKVILEYNGFEELLEL